VQKTLAGQAALDDYNLIYASKSNQVVFIRTITGEIWRSADEGDNWDLQTVNSKMPGIEQTAGKVRLRPYPPHFSPLKLTNILIKLDSKYVC